jgi:hypothetical protein
VPLPCGRNRGSTVRRLPVDASAGEHLPWTVPVTAGTAASPQVPLARRDG